MGLKLQYDKLVANLKELVEEEPDRVWTYPELIKEINKKKTGTRFKLTNPTQVHRLFFKLNGFHVFKCECNNQHLTKMMFVKRK